MSTSSFIFESFDFFKFHPFTWLKYDNFRGIASNESRICEKHDFSRIQKFRKVIYFLKKSLLFLSLIFTKAYLNMLNHLNKYSPDQL